MEDREMEEQNMNSLAEEMSPEARQSVSAAVKEPREETAPVKGSKYEQISTLGFLGILLLLGIPVVGPILMIVWACGGCRKLQKRRFARAKLILAVFNLLLSVALVFAAVRAVSNVMDQLGISSVDEIGGVVETIVTGELTEGTEKLVSEMIEGYVGGEVELNEEQKAQLGELVDAYLNGELPLDPEMLEELMQENGF
jgi:hypothetical protein